MRSAPRLRMSTILQLRGIDKAFAGVQALAGVDLTVEQGEIHALLGENGAGKSTLTKVISGIHQPDAGTIRMDSQERRFANFRDAAAAGIATIFQEFSLIPYLNAVDNIFLGREITRGGRLDRKAMRKRATELFEQLGYPVDLNVEIRALSVAQQQFIEIAKALSMDARVLILDEPTATLTPEETRHLFKVMRQLKQQNVALIFISHHLEEIFEICDTVTVLRDGRFVGDGKVSDFSMDSLVEMMVGRSLESSFPPRGAGIDDAQTVVEVRAIQLTAKAPVNSLQIRSGEILGFAGVVGAGRSELAMGLIGAQPTHRKEVLIKGEAVSLKSPAQALKLGIGLLPENRKTEGLLLSFSVGENIMLNNLENYLATGGLISRSGANDAVDKAMEQGNVKAPSGRTTVANLSGGNQQKVVIARWLLHRCPVLIFDEPTRGIDVGAKAEIYRLMRELADHGHAIVMISSELPEIVGMSDRVAVFRQGAIVATLTGDQIHPNEVMFHATGAQHEAA